METTDKEDEEMEDIPSQEILRENLMKSRRKRKPVAKVRFVEPKCPECGKVFGTKYGLVKHMRIHNKDNPFWCEHCSYKAKTQQYLNRHVKRVHGGPPSQHRCSYCDKAFHYKSSLANHERVHTGAKPYSCDVCGKSFSATYSLATHKFIHTDEKPFKCTFCDYACRDSSTLRKHKSRHTGTLKMHPCSICSRQFDSKCGLRVHMTETHIEPDVRNYKCEICDGAFKKKWVLNQHIETVHARSKACVCSICNVKLTNYHNLKAHMRIHVDIRPFHCAVEGCGLTFKDWAGIVCNYHNLKAHMRIHVDIRPFHCAVEGCGLTFKDWDTLKRHGKVHNKKHLICDECRKRFSRKNLLIQHIKVMHMQRKKTEMCGFCGVGFYSQQYLSKHIEQKHSRRRKKYICDWCDFVTHNKPSIVMHIKYGHKLDKGKCKICGKAYKKDRYLRLHYANTHKLKFKTDTKIEDIEIPDIPELKLKEEPFDFPDIEIDLLDIDKEEPFADLLKFGKEEPAGFDTADQELVSELPDVLDRMREKEQTLQEFLDQVMLNPADDVTVAAENGNDQQRDQCIQMQSLNRESNQTPQESISMPVEEFIQQMVGDVGGTQDEDFSLPNTTWTTDNDIDQQSLNKDSNLPSNDKLQNTTQTEQSVPTEGDGIQEKVLNQSETTTPPDSDKQKRKPKKKSKNKHKTKLQRTPMPVQEFIQKFVGNTQETKDKSVIVDHDSLEAAERRLKELLMKMNRTDSGKLGVMKYKGRKSLKVFTEEEVENMKSNPKAGKVTQNDEDNRKGDGNDDKSGDDDEKGSEKEETPRILKSFWKMHQCYICFKIFDTKPKLIDHCKEHFDVCNEVTLKKCPLCAYVTTKSDIRKHLRKKHKEDIKISFMDIKEKRNATGSKYYYNTENDKIKELDIIPSIKILNKKAAMDLDKKNREKKDKLVGKHKLVKKGNEWIVEKEKIDLSGHVLPDSKDLDKNSDNYLETLQKLGKEAKRKGVKMLYPCNKCEKLCQNLSALTLHSRKHDPNPKPFRPRGWIRKDREKRQKIAKKQKVNPENRLADPKPVVNNHKCDPKLIDFYENNIKGGDIEFWQFLKIYNKMDRDHVNSFEDLQANPEFGIHLNANNPNNNTVENNSSLEKNSKNIKAKNKVTPKNANLIKDKKVTNKDKVKKVNNNKFVRTNRLSKLEYKKRMEIKRKLRENILIEEKSN